MARRDITNYQTVTDVVAPAPDKLVPALAEIGQDIIRKSQEAKIVENLSAAQLDLGKLSNDFQTKYQGDPFNEQGLKDFRSQRQDIIDQYGEGISPLFGRAWKEGAGKLTSSNDLANQAWGFKQADANTKNSLINTSQNNLVQTGLDGEAFAAGKIGLTEALLNIDTSLEQMREFGNTNLGATSTDAIMRDMGQDHIKTFISSVAKTNPVMALRLMDEEAVKSEVTNQEEFAKFREAVESRAIKFQVVAKQTEILDTLKGGNALLASGKVLSYAEIMHASSGMSEESKKYFLKANGYTTEGADGPKWKADQKLEYKAAVYDEITKLSTAENIAPEDIQTLQDKIYLGMRRGALKPDEGASFITQLMTPLIEQKEKSLSEFTTGDWNPFKTDPGLPAIKEYYDNSVEIQPGVKANGKPRELGKVSQMLNARRKVQLYDDYLGALQVEAQKNNVRVGDIPQMDRSKRRDIYRKAQDEAISSFNSGTTPVLKTQPDIPITAIKDLQADPSLSGDFDKKYGKGSASRALAITKTGTPKSSKAILDVFSTDEENQ